MKQLILPVLAILLAIRVFGQIDMNDSTVQVIGYWDKGEKQTYLITHEKYAVRDVDTSDREFQRYIVDITVVDSTADYYTIDWYYHDYEIKTESELVRKLSLIPDSITITVRTDELGVLKEVMNWEEVRDFILKRTALLKDETEGIPNMDKVIARIESLYGSKESIESAAINEIRQFHTFHGARYKSGEEYNTVLQVPNLYGDVPFDSEVTVWLDAIEPGENNYILRMRQSVDSEQLTRATFEHLTKLSNTMQAPGPEWEEFPVLFHDTWTASRIHESGWVIYSAETKEVSAEGQTHVEKTTIVIQ